MRKSRKMLLGSLLGVYAMIFILVGVNRATESRDYLPETQRVRTPQTDLDSYTGFNRIVARGDFDLEVVSGLDWAIDYQPLDEDRGALNANQAGQTLTLEGFGNRGDTGRGRVTITLPALDELSADFHTEVSVRGFDQDRMAITARNIRTLLLSGNTLDTIELELFFLQQLSMEGNSFATEQLSISSSNTVINRQ